MQTCPLSTGNFLPLRLVPFPCMSGYSKLPLDIQQACFYNRQAGLNTHIVELIVVLSSCRGCALCLPSRSIYQREVLRCTQDDKRGFHNAGMCRGGSRTATWQLSTSPPIGKRRLCRGVSRRAYL